MYQYYTHFYLWISIPLYVYTTICLSTHTLMNICFFFLPLAIVSSAAMNIGTYVFLWVIIFNSLRCISSRILGYMVILCLTFWGTISLPNFFFFAHIFNISGIFSFLPGNMGCYVFPAPLNLKNSFITSKVPLQHLFTISVYLKMPYVQLILKDNFSGYRILG